MAESPPSLPTVSIGLPVYNGEDTAKRCLDSILAQDFRDFELVVSDNASSDRTPEILADYARRDPRVRVSRNAENIGQIRNFNRVFRLARGTYFCWAGIDDWFEPTFLSEMVKALEADPEAILATSFFTLNEPNRPERSLRHQHKFLESPRPERRFARALALFHLPPEVFDPMHGMLRRSALPDADPLLVAPFNDWIFTAGLALAGRSVHVPRALYHRFWVSDELYEQRRSVRTASERKADMDTARRLGPLRARLLDRVRAARLSTLATLACHVATLGFVARELSRRYVWELRNLRRQRLGITRSRLRGLRRPRA